MAYWYIAKSKLKFEGKEDIPAIDKDLWRTIVEQDNELFWFETTPLGKEYFSDPYANKKDLKLLIKTKAHMDFNKKYGHGNVQFNFNNDIGHIPILHTRTTLNRIEKYFEIAEKLGAKLFKNKTWINEEELNKLRNKSKKTRKKKTTDNKA